MRTYFFSTVWWSALVLMLVPVASRAADTVTLPADQHVPGNYYVSGSTVEIDGEVGSDLVVAGGTVVVKGPIGGDVIVAGGNVRLLGPVTGNVRGLAGTLEVATSVGHNITVAADKLVLAPGSEVLGHITAAANQMAFAGKVGGSVQAAGGTVQMSGTVNGPVVLWLGQQGSLELTKTAVVNGPFTYHGPAPAQIATGAKLASAPQFIPWVASNSNRGWWWGKLVGLFSSLVLGLVVVSLLPRKVMEVAEQAVTKPWSSLGWGALWAIAVPLTVVVLLITLIGISVAAVLAAFYLIGLVVARVAAGAAVAWWLKSRFKGALDKWSPLVLVLSGIVLFSLLSTLPLVGLIGTLWGWGALLQVQKRTVMTFR